MGAFLMDRITLGIDTSLRSTGIGIIRAEGNAHTVLYYAPIRTSPSKPMSEALAHLEIEINRLLEEWQPTEAAIEGVFYAKNAKTAMILCHARGVVVAACAKRNIPVYEYSPTEVKRAVTGVGSAEKAQVQMMVARILSIKAPLQNDAADALAIALAHLHRVTSVLTLQPKTL
ncbi:MAG: crossover junction endodeoxyribonuclease RuvC [Kiritimatiellia bacterium]